MAGTVPTTTLAALVVALRAQVQAKLGFPPERVLPHAGDADDPDPFPAQAEQFVLIHAGPGRADPGLFAGAARNAPLVRQEVFCTLWTRLVSDDPSTDEAYLLDASLGHLKYTNLLFDALYAFQPLDGGGVWMVEEPLYPEAWQPPKKVPGRKGWGRSTLRVVVTYFPAVDPSYQ